MLSFYSGRRQVHRRRNPNSTRRPLGLEPLEERSLLATASLVDGTLLIQGTDGDDRIEVRPVLGRELEVTGITSGSGRFPVADVAKIVVNGNAGNDLIRVDPDVTAPAVLSGQGGNDTLYGAAGADWLSGDDGADRVYGGIGDDTVFGGDGDDALFGGHGYDRLYGGGGDDFVDAGGSAGRLFEHNLVDGGTGRNFDAHQWAINGARFTDVLQPYRKPNCVFMASLSALALDASRDLSKWVVYVGDGKYDVRVYEDGLPAWRRVDFLGAPPDNDYQSSEDFGAGNFREFWTHLFEKAYAPVSGKALPKDALERLAADQAPFAVFAGKFRADHQRLIRDGLRDGKLLVYGTKPKVATKRLVTSHAYTVIGIDGKGNVLLRNPWGFDVAATGRCDGSFGNPQDGVTQVSWSEFVRSAAALYVAVPPPAEGPPAAWEARMAVPDKLAGPTERFNLRVEVRDYRGRPLPATCNYRVFVAPLGQRHAAAEAAGSVERVFEGLPAMHAGSSHLYEVWVESDLYKTAYGWARAPSAGGTAEAVIHLVPVRVMPNPSGTWVQTSVSEDRGLGGWLWRSTLTSTLIVAADERGSVTGTVLEQYRDSLGNSRTGKYKVEGFYDDVTGKLSLRRVDDPHEQYLAPWDYSGFVSADGRSFGKFRRN